MADRPPQWSNEDGWQQPGQKPTLLPAGPRMTTLGLAWNETLKFWEPSTLPLGNFPGGEESKSAKKLAEEAIEKAVKAEAEAKTAGELAAAQAAKVKALEELTEAIELEIEGGVWNTFEAVDSKFVSLGAPFSPVSSRAHLGRGELRGAFLVLETFAIGGVEGSQHVATLQAAAGRPAAERFATAVFVQKGQVSQPQNLIIETDGKVLIYITGNLTSFEAPGYLQIDSVSYPL